MDLEVVEFEGKPFKYRKGNYGDKLTIKENLHGKQYSALKLTPEDIVLDIGGHIGTFAVPTALKVKELISIEMDKENFDLLKMNTSRCKNISAYNYAVVTEDSPETVEYYRGTNNSGATSMHIKKGRGEAHVANTISIEVLLEDLNPTIIKCDIEGAEYDILDGLGLPDCVKQVIIEFHFGHKEWRDKANKIQASLKKQGFKFNPVDCTKDKLWIRLMYFKR